MTEDEIKAHVAAVLDADADEAKAKASAAALVANVIYSLQRIADGLILSALAAPAGTTGK